MWCTLKPFCCRKKLSRGVYVDFKLANAAVKVSYGTVIAETQNTILGILRRKQLREEERNLIRK